MKQLFKHRGHEVTTVCSTGDIAVWKVMIDGSFMRDPKTDQPAIFSSGMVATTKAFTFVNALAEDEGR